MHLVLEPRGDREAKPRKLAIATNAILTPQLD